MAGPGQARFYSSTFVQTSLTAGIGPSSTSFGVGVTTGAPGTPYVISVDQNTASEELMLVTNVSGTTYTVTRGVGGTSAVTHATGASVVHVMYAQDLTDASAHIGAYDAVHGLSSGSLVVGTTDTQTLSNKTINLSVLNSPTINTPTIAGATSAGQITSNASITGTVLVASGITGATAASRYVGATASGAPASGGFLTGDFVIDQTGLVWVCTATGSPGTWVSLVNTSATQTLTNKTLTSPVLSGGTTGTGSILLTNFIRANDFQAIGLTGAGSASRYVGATMGGAPTSGTFVAGDFVVDQTGNLWVCTTGGTPGTWAPVGGSQGIVAVPTSTATAGTVTSGATETFDAVLGTHSFNVVNGRRYRVCLTGLLGSGTAVADVFRLLIRNSGTSSPPTTSSTVVASTQWYCLATGGPGETGITLTGEFIAGSTGTNVIEMSAVRISGTGTYQSISSGGVNRNLYVEDLGVF